MGAGGVAAGVRTTAVGVATAVAAAAEVAAGAAGVTAAGAVGADEVVVAGAARAGGLLLAQPVLQQQPLPASRPVLRPRERRRQVPLPRVLLRELLSMVGEPSEPAVGRAGSCFVVAAAR